MRAALDNDGSTPQAPHPCPHLPPSSWACARVSQTAALQEEEPRGVLHSVVSPSILQHRSAPRACVWGEGLQSLVWVSVWCRLLWRAGSDAACHVEPHELRRPGARGVRGGGEVPVPGRTGGGRRVQGCWSGRERGARRGALIRAQGTHSVAVYTAGIHSVAVNTQVHTL